MSTLSDFSAISEISTEKTFWNLKGKIIRLWQVSDFNGNKMPFSIELVLLDEAGDRIHATIKKTLLYKFKNDLFEGKCYSFENMGVANNGGATTRHTYKLNFQFSSKVQYLPSLNITKSPYQLIPISEVIGGSYDTDYLVDIIGVLFGVGSERELERNGTTTKLNVIEIEAGGFKIQCTLFGSFVDELNNFIASGDIQNAIVIVQLAKAKCFQDKIHVQNCLGCTKVIYKPTCHDAVSMRNRLSETVDTPSPLGLTQLQPEAKLDPREEFIYQTPRTTMQGLKDASNTSVYVVLGTIKRIVNRENFWYTACQCSKVVIPDSHMFYCEKCDKHVKKVFSRYCLRVRTIDHTDCATLVIFNKEAHPLFNKSCVDMLAEHGVAISEGHLPPEIAAIIGKTYLFKVDTKANQNPRFEQSFRVRKMCVVPDVIDEFTKKWKVEDAAFFKNTMESSSLSVLMEKGKNPMIADTSDVLDNDEFSLSEPVGKCKEMVLGEGSGVVTVDLLPKFSEAGCQPEVVQLSNKSESASSKRGSPTNDEDDINMPLKMLRKAIKIEKP